MATKKEILGAYAIGEGPLAQAHDDEELFIVRAADATAPAAVRTWTELAYLIGAHPEKLSEAKECAIRMLLWQGAHPELVKVPD